MKHITIIVPEGEGNLSTLASVAGAYEILLRANSYWRENNRQELYKVEIAGNATETEICNGIFSIKPRKNILAIERTNLIIIPSLVRDHEKVLDANKSLIRWITNQYKEGAEIASMCTGAFMLAASGVLNGKSCSTHWSAVDAFRNMFPEVRLQPDKLITDEKGIYTNGGAYSFLNLILYLVEKYFDRQTAIYCSKIFQIELDRNSQSAFIIFKGQKQHGDNMVKEAQSYIEDHLDEKIPVDDLAAEFAVSRRNFDRRFIRATGNSPVEYAQRVKVEFAKKAFETTRKNVNEVMYEVGYADEKSFREVFRKITGLTPMEYKNKYNNEMVELK